MSNNTQLNPATGAGDLIVTVDLNPFTAYPTSGKVPGGVLYVGSPPLPVSGANPLPVSGPVTQSGTWNVTVNTALPVGANVIGGVTQSGTWNVGLSAGAATIGNVTITDLEAGLAAGAAPTKMVVVGVQHNTALPAPTNGQTIALQSDQTGTPYVNPSGRLPANVASSGVFTLVASATDIATLTGSGTKTIRVQKVLLQIASSSTTPALATVNLYKRSTVDTGGSPGGMSGFQFDTGNSSFTASAQYYTSANPVSVGTPVGFMGFYVPLLSTGAVLDGNATGPTVLDFTTNPIVLRGTAQQIAINLGGTTPAGGMAAVTFVWTEDDS